MKDSSKTKKTTRTGKPQIKSKMLKKIKSRIRQVIKEIKRIKNQTKIKRMLSKTIKNKMMLNQWERSKNQMKK